MSKKSRTTKPGDTGPAGRDETTERESMTVFDGKTERLPESSAGTLATSDPNGTLVTRADQVAADADNQPTAMLDVAAVKAAAAPPAPPVSSSAPKAPSPPVPAPPAARPSSGASLADAKTMVAPVPAQPTKPSEPAPAVGRLGLDIVMRWSGEMHKARFYATPQPVTIGADGAFALPENVMGGKQVDVLVEPDAKDQFALALGNSAIRGQVIVGSDVYAIADIKAGKTPLNKDRVPVTAKTHAFVEFGEFTFVLSRGAVPPPARPSLWDKEDSLLLGAFALSALVLLGPIIASFQLADPRARHKMNYVEQLEERVAQIIEVEKIEEKPEEAPQKAEEKQEQKQEAPVQPQQVDKQVQKQADEIKKALDAATPEEREAKKQELVAREVDKATAVVDEALANVPTTKLAALGEAGDADQQAGAAPTVLLDTGSGPSDGGGRKGPAVGGEGDTGKQVATGLEKQGVGGPGPKLTADVKTPAQKVIRMGGGQSAEGELPPEVIKKVLADKSGAIKACYQRELQSNPDLQGAVKVKFVIGPNGAVVGVKIEQSSIDSAKVEECITAILKLLRFPQAKGGGVTTVNKTFQFKST